MSSGFSSRGRKGRDAVGGALVELAIVCAYMAAGFLACLLLVRI